MGKEYSKIDHNLSMRWVNATYQLFKRITIAWTFKEIRPENIDILKSDNRRKMLLGFPHSSLDDMILPHYEIVKYNLEQERQYNQEQKKKYNDSSRKTHVLLRVWGRLLYSCPMLPKSEFFKKYSEVLSSYNPPINYPITFAGSNLLFRPYLRKVGCAKFRRNAPMNLEEINYAAYLLGKEDRDVLFFPGFVEYEERRKKSGRTWDGRIQKMSRIPVVAAEKCYEKYGKDIDFIIINITYEPLTPEEGAFQLLMDGEFSKKWYYGLAKKTHVKQLVTLVDFFQFIRPYRRLNITAHISFYGPYSFRELYERFSNYDNPTQEVCNFLENEGKSKMKLTAQDVWAYSIRSDDAKEAVSPETSVWNYVSKRIKNGLAALVRENPNGKTYRNDEIMKNASELIKSLKGKVDLSLVDKKDILSEVKKSRVVFMVNGNTTTVNDKYLFNYHRNRVDGLLKTYGT
jgi:hypothetical protein